MATARGRRGFAPAPFPCAVPAWTNTPTPGETRMAITVEANPYRWPYDGDLVPARTALILIDWQQDFCGPGGYVDRMGYDISLTRAGIAATRAVLAACRDV